MPRSQVRWDAGRGFDISEDIMAAYRAAYPKVDVAAELAKMHVWLLSNPRRAATYRVWSRFVNGWLQRAQQAAALDNGERIEIVKRIVRW